MHTKIVSLLLLFPLYSFALTLDDVIQKTLLHNNGLKKIEIDALELKKVRESVKSQRLGSVDFIASYDHYNKARTLAPLTPMDIVSSPTGAYEIPSTNDMFTSGISYKVVLFDGYAQKNSYDISDILHKNSLITSKLAKEELIYNVRTLYVSLLALEEQLQSFMEYTKIQEKLYKKIYEQYTLGSQSKLDYLKSKNSYQESRSDEDKIRANIGILKASLRMLMGGEPCQDVEKIAINMEDEKYEDPILSQLNRYKIAEEKTILAKKKVAKASSAYYPKVDFNAYYGYAFGPNATNNVYPSTGVSFIGKDDFNSENIWQLGVHLKWNIYDFGSKSSFVEKERLALQNAHLAVNDVRLELEKNIEIAENKLLLAKADYTSATSQYELLQEILKAEEIKYDSDAITIDDLLYAKAKTKLALSKIITSKYEYLKVKYYRDYLYEKGEK